MKLLQLNSLRVLRIKLLMFGVMTTISGFAQQLTHYGLWSESRYLYNPAWAGSDQKMRLLANYRSQWVGIQGQPQTYLVGVNTAIPVIRSGVGMVFERDQTGNRSFSTVSFQYNYKLLQSSKVESSVGFSANLRSFSLTREKVLTPEGVFGNPTDNVLENYPANVQLSQVGLGWALSWSGFEAGVSYLQGMTAELNDNSNYKAEPELFIRAAYNFTLNNSLIIVPYSVFYTNFSVNQLYAAADLRWKNRLVLSVGLRSLLENAEAATISFGTNVTQGVLLRYQYEVGLSGIASASQGAHEVIVLCELDWSLGQWKEQPPVYSPRTY